MRFLSVSNHTWKHHGLSLNELKYRTTIGEFLQYEEMMYIQNDYLYAGNKDAEVG